MKKFLLTLGISLVCTSSLFAEEKVLWQTGMEGLDNTNGTVPGQYETGLIVDPTAFEGIEAGAQMNIYINSSEWAQIYIKNYDKNQIYPSIDLNVGQNVTVVLTNFQLDQIAEGGLRIDASTTLEITKVTVDTDIYKGDYENALWIGNQTFTADWGGTPVQICPLEAAELQAGEILKVYYTKTADDAYMMVNYIGSEISAQPDWQYFDGGEYFVITEDFLSGIGNGFCVKGYSINVSQVDLESNSGESLVESLYFESNSDIVNIYNIAGNILYKNVKVTDVIRNLPSGLYIIGNKKVIVR